MNVNDINSVQNYTILNDSEKNKTVTKPSLDKQTKTIEHSKQMVNAQTALASYTMPKVNMSFKGKTNDKMSDEKTEKN